jgi:hypothetical protein
MSAMLDNLTPPLQPAAAALLLLLLLGPAPFTGVRRSRLSKCCFPVNSFTEMSDMRK